jgi:hypothetical protein
MLMIAFEISRIRRGIEARRSIGYFKGRIGEGSDP